MTLSWSGLMIKMEKFWGLKQQFYSKLLMRLETFQKYQILENVWKNETNFKVIIRFEIFFLFFFGGGYNRRLKFLRGGVPVIKSSLVNFSFFPPQGIRVIFNTKLICFHYPWIVHSIIWYKIMLTNPTCLVDLEKIKFECTSKSHNEYNVSLLHIFTPQNCIWNTIIFFWKEVIQKLCWPDFGIFRAPTYPWLTLLKTFSYFYVYEVLFMCQWHFSYHLPTSSWQRSFWRTTNEINHFFSVFKVQILDK